MVKYILNHLSRGFFYSIGRILAFLVIGLILGYLFMNGNINPLHLLT